MTLAKYILYFMMLSTSVSAYDGLYNDSELAKYPALAQFAKDANGKIACAPAAWTFLSDYIPANIENLLLVLGNNPVETEAKTILTDRKNPCFRVALIYAFYLMMHTDFKTGETDGWYLSESLLKKIYSGDQIMPGDDLLARMETSLNSGMPAIVWAKGKEYDHIWLVTGITPDRKFVVLPSRTYDFYGGDYGSFYGLSTHMNFVNLREYKDGAPIVDTPEDIYGGDSGACFYSSVIGHESTRNNKWITSPSGKIKHFMDRYK